MQSDPPKGTSDDQQLQSGSTTTGMIEVNRLTMRVPPFWPEKPAMWFAQIESQFHLNGIKQDGTKFWHVIAQLENRYATEVEDVITNPPVNDTKYETIKRELVRRLSVSQQSKLKRLLEREELGDRTPSQFLRHLRSLADSTVQEEFLRTLWLNQLPPMYEAILCAQSDLTLEKIADIADRLHETQAASRITEIAAHRNVHHPANHLDPTSSSLDLISEQVRQLSIRLDELTRQNPMPGSRYRPKSRANSTNRSITAPAIDNVCWYHAKFKEAARRCRSPCSFPGNDKNRH